MRLIDEEEIEEQKLRNKKFKKIIIISISVLLILCCIIVAAIVYRLNNPTQITTYIDNVKVNNFDKILDFTTNENGETEIYIPIRDFATYLNGVNAEFNYQTFKGEYNPKTEEEDKCYVIRDKYEVAMFAQKTKTIYKLNLQNKSDEYEECNIDKDVFESGGKLYASEEGIEEGYNVSFSYDEQKKIIKIYTLDYISKIHQNNLAKKSIGNYGTVEMSESYSDLKSIFEGIIIVKTESNKYGLITDDYSSFILEPQYDNISYIPDSKTFLVTSNKKVGVFTKDGKRKINLVYDKITSMGRDSKLYVVETNKMQGVVDENGKIIIYPENDQIGINVSSFSYNGVKNGYILLDKLIPVKRNNLWAFYDTGGKKVTSDFKYKNIGCTNIKSGNNIYPLLQIPEYNVIVVSDELGKFAFVDTEGNDSILNFIFDQIYIKVSGGEENYYMTFRDKEYEVLKYLKQTKGQSEGSTSNNTNNTNSSNTNSNSNSNKNNTNSTNTKK